jgi:hypothetical protein
MNDCALVAAFLMFARVFIIAMLPVGYPICLESDFIDCPLIAAFDGKTIKPNYFTKSPRLAI